MSTITLPTNIHITNTKDGGFLLEVDIPPELHEMFVRSLNTWYGGWNAELFTDEEFAERLKQDADEQRAARTQLPDTSLSWYLHVKRDGRVSVCTGEFS